MMGYAMEASLFLHLLSVAVWVGGMVFAHFCLRPALADLSPQLRLPLLEAVLGRFFNWVAVAITLIVLSGGYMLMQFGGAEAPWQLNTMAALGVLMMMAFGHIRFAVFPRIHRAVQSQRWPDGASAVVTIRRLVLFNLVLGVLTIGIAVTARF